MWRLKHMMGLEGHQGPGGNQTAGPLEGKAVEVGRVQVQVRSTIAQGGFAFVYLARCAHSGRAYALKHIVCGDPDTMEQIQREVSILMALRGHPNIVTLHAHALLDSAGSAGLGSAGAAVAGAGGMGHGGAGMGGLGGGGMGGSGSGGGRKEVFLLMEHCERTLVDVMAARGTTPFDEKTLLLTFRDVCNAVFAMHCQHPPVAHRDLKAENLLQCGDGSWRLCDFGSASTRHRRIERAADMGIEEDVIRRNTTPAYRAPELWDLYQKEMLSEKVDIWALGCLLYRMAYFRSAFDGESKLQVLNGRYSIPDMPRYSPAVPALIRDLLAMQPHCRPDVLQVWRRVNELLPPEMRKASPDWPPLTPKPTPGPAASAAGRRPSSPSPQHLQQQQQQQRRESAPDRNAAPAASAAGGAGTFWANFDSFPTTQAGSSGSAAAPAPPAPTSSSIAATSAAAAAAAGDAGGSSRPSSARASAGPAERVGERRTEEERRGNSFADAALPAAAASAASASAGAGAGVDSDGSEQSTTPGASKSSSPAAAAAAVAAAVAAAAASPQRSPPRSRLAAGAEEVERLRGELQRVVLERDELRVTCNKLTLVVQTQQADIASLQAALAQQQQQSGTSRGSSADVQGSSAARRAAGGAAAEKNEAVSGSGGSRSQTGERLGSGEAGGIRQGKGEEEIEITLRKREQGGGGEGEEQGEADQVINLRFEDIGSPVPVSDESLKRDGTHRGGSSNNSRNGGGSSSSSSSSWRRASAGSGASGAPGASGSGAVSKAAGSQGAAAAAAAGEAAYRRNSSPAHHTTVQSSSPSKAHLQQTLHHHQQQQQQHEKEQGYWQTYGSASSSALPSVAAPAAADLGGSFSGASASFSSSGGRGSVNRPRSPLPHQQTEGSNNAAGSWKESGVAGFGAGAADAGGSSCGGTAGGGQGWQSFGSGGGAGAGGAFSASGFESSQPQQLQQQQQQYASAASAAQGFSQPSGWAAF
ncbi:unnamed protein product [Closterium sp. NIES-53]